MNGEEANGRRSKKDLDIFPQELDDQTTENMPVNAGFTFDRWRENESNFIPNEIKHEITLGNDLWFLATLVNYLDSRSLSGKG